MGVGHDFFDELKGGRQFFILSFSIAFLFVCLFVLFCFCLFVCFCVLY